MKRTKAREIQHGVKGTGKGSNCSTWMAVTQHLVAYLKGRTANAKDEEQQRSANDEWTVVSVLGIHRFAEGVYFDDARCHR